MSSDLLSFLAWYAAVSVAGLLALPLAFRLFRHLPDRGYAFAKPFGLLAAGYVFWLLGSLGFLRNDVGGVLFAALLVGAAGVAWLRAAGLRELWTWLRAARPVVIGVEVVFVLAFAGLAWVRAHNPDIHGTEKPMEYMFINAILQSPTFPPQDAWLAGHAISYYYFGYLLVAALARVTATASSVAFNLALALLFALTAVGSLGVVMNLIALARGFVKPGPAPTASPITHYQLLITSFRPALLAPLLVLVVGNFYGLAQFAYQNGLWADQQIPTVRYYFGELDPANAGATADPDAPLVSTPGARFGMVNVWDWLDLKETQEPAPRPTEWRWDTGGMWFFAARVVHDRDLLGNDSYLEAIDENPAFSFLLGDLHPHVLALPFVVLATGLALEWLLWAWSAARRPPAEAGPTAGQGQGDGFALTLSFFRLPPVISRVLLSAVILGALSFLNTWDFPIYLFLTLLATALGYGLAHGRAALMAALPRLAGLGLGLAVLSVVLYLPFYLTFQSQAGGILPNLIFPTRFQQSFVFFGPVLIGVLLYVVWLAYRGRAAFDRRAALWTALGLLCILMGMVAILTLAGALNPGLAATIDRFLAPLSRGEALRLALERRLVDSLATLAPLAILGLAAGVALGQMGRTGSEPAVSTGETRAAPASTERAWRRRPGLWGSAASGQSGAAGLNSPAVFMVLAMLVTGALLMLGPEYVYLRDNFGHRMNTLFKFYFQAWTLWALAAAFGAWHLAQYARRGVRAMALGVFWLALLGGLVTTTTSLYAKTGGFANAPTLDGMAWYARAYPNEWAAIQWLRANAQPRAGRSPVILEAVGGAYNIEEARVSMGTGFPTLMGWTNHEGQWRGDYYTQVAIRVEQVSTVYQARDWSATLDILDQYGVEYVIVGAEERSKYNPVYSPKFDQFMDMVFEAGDLTIYRRKPQQAQ